MQSQYSQCSVFGVRKSIDDCVKTVAAHDVVVDSCSLYELAVMSTGQERVRQVAEELLEQSSYGSDVVVEGGGISKIDC